MPKIRGSGRINAVRTSTITGSGVQRRPSTTAYPFLFIALRCDDPTQPGARFCLEGVESVSVGRLPSLTAVREGDELRIGIPDGHVSTSHLRLLAGDGRWTAEDSGSKNGTFLDGRRISREPLGDGALLEVGHTFLLFRAALPGRRSADTTVVCGHWAALGLRIRADLLALDSGCVWGGALTAVRLEDRAVFQQPSLECRGRRVATFCG